MLKRDLALALQYGLPHRLLSRIMYYLTRSEWRWLKNLLIRRISGHFKVDMNDALEPDLDAYPSFNAFFTRALRPNARPIASGTEFLVSPADGVVSQAGAIIAGELLQAKGMQFSVAELLADSEAAEHFANGSFATVYLSPRDYHRVHMPCAARLVKTLHVPGRLFSVAQWTAESIPRLFARNERLVCLFDSEHGRIAVVFVGAIFVSSIDTVWSGAVTPPYAPKVLSTNISQPGPRFEAGAEIGRFNMGSTIVVLSERAFVGSPGAVPGAPVKVGQLLGTFVS